MADVLRKRKLRASLTSLRAAAPPADTSCIAFGWGLKETDAKLANGRKVYNRNDAVVWLIERLEEGA